MENIVEDFCRFTEELLQAKKTYGTLHTFSTKDCWSLVHQMEEVYNEILDHKNYYKGGQRVKFGTWLIDSMFPRPLYESAGGSLIKLLEDKRFFHPPSSLSKKGNFHNFFGRMARPPKSARIQICWILGLHVGSLVARQSQVYATLLLFNRRARVGLWRIDEKHRTN